MIRVIEGFNIFNEIFKYVLDHTIIIYQICLFKKKIISNMSNMLHQ